MNATEIRLECVRLAEGNITQARAIYDFVTGADSLKAYVESAGYPKDDCLMNQIKLAKQAGKPHVDAA